MPVPVPVPGGLPCGALDLGMLGEPKNSIFFSPCASGCTGKVAAFFFRKAHQQAIHTRQHFVPAGGG